VKEEWKIKKSAIQISDFLLNGCSCVATEDRYQIDRCRGQLTVSPPSLKSLTVPVRTARVYGVWKCNSKYS
jgi:hypothetical protein